MTLILITISGILLCMICLALLINLANKLEIDYSWPRIIKRIYGIYQVIKNRNKYKNSGKILLLGVLGFVLIIGGIVPDVIQSNREISETKKIIIDFIQASSNKDLENAYHYWSSTANKENINSLIISNNYFDGYKNINVDEYTTYYSSSGIIEARLCGYLVYKNSANKYIIVSLIKDTGDWKIEEIQTN